ncbi:MAG: hypothetical protein V3U24_04810 [Candidatus Neomarinimicrobiota bacterium]
MKRFERFVYDRIKNRPALKRLIVRVYQRAFSIIPVDDLHSAFSIRVREGYFFGFHDKCPWSPDNRMLLAHKYHDSLKRPGPHDEVEIGYFQGRDLSRFVPVSTTGTWNWQTGSMLQWVGQSQLIIHNDLDGVQHVSKIVDSDGETVRSLPRPICAINPDGGYALSHSFARLRRCAPEYGYANGEDPEEELSVPESDGLFLMNTKSGDIDKVFSLKEIASVEPESSMEDSYHYFTHCLFSPSGERFIFFHRWLTGKGLTWTRMISCDLNGNDLFVFPTSGTVTHTTWRDEDTVLAYASTEKLGDHYYLFEDRTGEFSIFGEDLFTSDGHPQYSHDRTRFVTDTYPNRSRIQFLILCDIENNRRIDLARIHSPFRYRRELRCDLHPRWDRKGTMICFDSAHTGVRALCTLELHPY